MTEQRQPLSDLKELAEQEIARRRDEVGGEDRARELLDVPSADPQELARDQSEE